MEGFLKYKGGQRALGIASIGVIAIALLVAAVILGLGGTVLEKIQGTQTDNSATTPKNQTLSWPGNDTWISVTEGRVISGSEKVWNLSGTDIVLLTSGTHYTMSNNNIKFTNDTDPGMVFASTFNVSYSYKIGSQAYNSSNFGMTGVSTMAEFIPTIAIVAIAAIVIGVVMVMFGRRRVEGE